MIAHSIRDRDVDPEFIAELKRRNVGYIPTLTRDLSVFQFTHAPDYLTDPFFLRGEALFAPQIARAKDPALHAKRSRARCAKREARPDQALRNLNCCPTVEW